MLLLDPQAMSAGAVRHERVGPACPQWDGDPVRNGTMGQRVSEAG